MRLWLLLLSAALVTAVIKAQEPYNGMPMTRYKLPPSKLSSDSKLADGTIITFYFEHTWKDSKPTVWDADLQKVFINFYDFPSVDVDEAYDITAHLRIEMTLEKPVHINSYVNNRYKKWTNYSIKLDSNPVQDGRWRVDMYKHEKYRMSVFFQGYFAGTHEFEKPLDNIKSIYVISDYVKHRSMKIPIMMPNIEVLPAVSATDFETKYVNAAKWVGADPIKQTTLPNGFQEGDIIDMVVVLRAWEWPTSRPASLVFKPKTGTSFFFKIAQKWEGGTHQLLFIHKGFVGEVCNKVKPNGELQHLKLKRTATTVTITVSYLPSGDNYVSKKECTYDIPKMEEPTDIVSENGAVLLNINQSRKALKKKREDL